MGKVQGEGDYRAAREYDEKVTAHAKDKAKVKSEAEAARAAVDGPEGEALKNAEDVGRSRAKR